MQDKSFVDYFNQPITEKSTLMVAVSCRLHLCTVIKFNRKSIVVKQVTFENGSHFRVNPIDTIVVSGEDLMSLTLRGKI